MVFALEVAVVALLARASLAVPVLIVSSAGTERVQICPYQSPCGECTFLLDGAGSPHHIEDPASVEVDSNGDYIIVESGEDRLVKCPPNPGGACSEVGGVGGEGSGPTQLNSPWGLIIDTSGNYLIVDKGNHRVQKCDPTGMTCETVAGGTGPGDGPAQLNNPYSVSFNWAGDYIIADSSNHRVQKCPAVPPGAECTTIAGGNGIGSGDDELNMPYHAIETPEGIFFVADKNNDRVMMCRPSGRCEVFTDEPQQPVSLSWDDLGGYVVVTAQKTEQVLRCKYQTPCEVVVGCDSKSSIDSPWGATLYDAPDAPTPAPPPAGTQCFSKSQCRRALKWWQKTLARKVKRGPNRYMNGFLHDSYFASCTQGAKKIAMVIPAFKSCPSKVHTRRSTKAFRDLAIARKQAFCKPVEYKVCSYCIQLNVPPGRGVMIETFKESVLVKPEPCKLWDFPNTPANN